jgi:hypothetical protein
MLEYSDILRFIVFPALEYLGIEISFHKIKIISNTTKNTYIGIKIPFMGNIL